MATRRHKVDNFNTLDTKSALGCDILYVMDKTQKKKQIMAVVYTLIGSVMFGLSFLFTKEAVNEVSALTLLAWRFVVAFLLMCLLAAVGVLKVNFRGKSIRPLLLMALFQPILYFVGETIGVQLTTSSESGVVIACIPIVVLIFSSVLLKEPPTKLQTASIIVSVIGVILVVLVKGFSASFNPIGYLMLLLAVVGDALYVTCARRIKDFSSAEKTFLMAAVGAVCFTAAAFLEHGIHGTVGEFVTLPFHNTGFLTSVLYLAAACQVLAFLLNNYGISVIGASRTASFAGITTVISVVASVVILKETFTWVQVAGGVLILLGVYGANITPKGAKYLPPEALDEIAVKSGERPL